MNSMVREQLMILVERVVRPIRAVGRDKKRIREELWSHVTAVFQEEFDQSKDEATALQQVQTRLGEPKELTAQFQQGTNGPSVFSYHFERWLNARPGESMFRTAVRQGFVATIVPVLVLLLAGLNARANPRLEKHDLYFLAAEVMLLGVGAALMFCAIRQAVYLAPVRSRFRAIALLLFTSSVPLIPLWLMYRQSAIFPPTVLVRASISTAFTCLLVPLIMLGLARKSSRAILESRTWEQLQID
jgi:hypothetical protein